MQKMYTKVDCYENDGKDDPVDVSGYYGQFYRVKKELTPISEAEMISIFAKSNKFIEVSRHIKEIDKDHNGFVTSTELDDILKLTFREELENRDLKEIIKKYSSL